MIDILSFHASRYKEDFVGEFSRDLCHDEAKFGPCFPIYDGRIRNRRIN